MRPFFIYIIELFLCSGLFLLLYRLLIVRKASYAFCRRYLIIAMLLSAVIPVLNVPLYPAQTVYMRVPVMTQPQMQAPSLPIPSTEQTPAVSAPAKTQTAATTAQTPTQTPVKAPSKPKYTSEQSWRIFFISVYGAGFILSLLLVCFSIITVVRLKRASRITHTPDFDLAESEKVTTPFSFIRTVFMKSESDEKTRSHILSHESSHVRHHHSVEKLIMSLLRSLFWFNPFMWIAEKRLEEVQEWQADHDALANGYNLSEYRLSIVKQLFGCNPDMTSGLNSSLTKQRFLQMKQPEIEGGTASKTIVTTLLAAFLFFCFGCCPTYGLSELPNGNQRTNSMIFFTDQFFNDKDVSKRADHYYSQKSADNRSVTEDISIYENYTGQYPYVTVAVNGIRTANSISDKKLSWVDESTAIFINGNKKSYQELQKLAGKDLTAYYFKPDSKRARKKYGFVYVNYGAPAMNGSLYYNPVAIDNPDLDIPDIVSVFSDPGIYGGIFFTYTCKGVTVAAPEIKYAVEGKMVDAQTFLNALSGQHGIYQTLYRNNAAKDRFGKDVWEVVELNYNRKAFSITFDFDENREVYAYIGNNAGMKATDDEILTQVSSVLEYNRTRGERTSIQAHSYLPEEYNEMINAWMDRFVDRSAPDISYSLHKSRRDIIVFADVQDFLNEKFKTIFSQDKVNYNYDNTRNISRNIVFEKNDSINENSKPNRIHIDEYDNMFIIVDEEKAQETDIKALITGIPGISVDEEGHVTSNDTKVKKVYLNGKEVSL